MASSNFCSVQVARTIFRVTRRQAVQAKPREVLDNNPTVGWAMEQLPGPYVWLQDLVNPGQNRYLRLESGIAVPYLWRIAICRIDRIRVRPAVVLGIHGESQARLAQIGNTDYFASLAARLGKYGKYK